MFFSFEFIIFVHLCFKKHYFNWFKFFVSKKVLLYQLDSKISIIFRCFNSSKFCFLLFDLIYSLLHLNELLLRIEWIFEETDFFFNFSLRFRDHSEYAIFRKLPRIQWLGRYLVKRDAFILWLSFLKINAVKKIVVQTQSILVCRNVLRRVSINEFRIILPYKDLANSIYRNQIETIFNVREENNWSFMTIEKLSVYLPFRFNRCILARCLLCHGRFGKARIMIFW